MFRRGLPTRPSASEVCQRSKARFLSHLLAATGLVIGVLAGAYASPASAVPTTCQATNTGTGVSNGNLQTVINAAGSGATIRVSGTCTGQFSIPGTGHATNLTLVGPATLDGGWTGGLPGVGRVLTVNS